MTQAPMPRYPPAATAYPVPQAPSHGTALAAPALVLGIPSFIPFGGPAAIILSIMALGTNRPGKGMGITEVQTLNGRFRS